MGLIAIRPKRIPNNPVNMLDPTKQMINKRTGFSIPRTRFKKFKMISPRKAPTMKISPCENWIKFKTPKNKVNPTATRLYITPSMIPLIN